jgi:hypothetical protein
MKISTALIVALVIGAAVFVFFRFGGKGNDTPEGMKADTTIAEYPAKRDSADARDKVIEKLRDTLQQVARERSRWKDSVKTLTAHVDDLHKVADTTGTLEPGITTSDTIFRLSRALEIQKQLSAKYRDEIIPAYKHQQALDSIQIRLADSTIEKQSQDRIILQKDLDDAIGDLTALRKATKPGPSIKIPLLGKLYVKDVVIATAAYCVGGGNPC